MEPGKWINYNETLRALFSIPIIRNIAYAMTNYNKVFFLFIFYSVCYDYYSKSLAEKKKSDAIPMIRNFNFSLFRRFIRKKYCFTIQLM